MTRPGGVAKVITSAGLVTVREHAHQHRGSGGTACAPHINQARGSAIARRASSRTCAGERVELASEDRRRTVMRGAHPVCGQVRPTGDRPRRRGRCAARSPRKCASPGNARFAEPPLHPVKYPVLWQSRKQQRCVVFAPRLANSTGSTLTASATLRCGTGQFARPKTLALPGPKCSARPVSLQLGSAKPYRVLPTITKPGIVLLWRGRVR